MVPYAVPVPVPMATASASEASTDDRSLEEMVEEQATSEAEESILRSPVPEALETEADEDSIGSQAAA